MCACVCSYVRCYYPSLQYLHHLSATRRLRKKGSWKTQALETKWRTNEKKPQVVYSAGCMHALMPAHKHLSSVVWNYNYSKEMWTSQRLIKQSVGDAARLGCVLTQACYATNPLQDAAECPTQKTPDNRLLLFFSLIAGRGSFWVALSLCVRGIRGTIMKSSWSDIFSQNNTIRWPLHNPEHAPSPSKCKRSWW